MRGLLRPPRWRLVALAATLAVAGGAVVWQLRTSPSKPPRAAQPAPAWEAVPQGVKRPVDATPPRRDYRPRASRRRSRGPVAPPLVEIPAIRVRAHVISLGLTRSRRLEVPGDPAEAGWWSGGPRPGRRGAAVIVGHVESQSGPAIFYRLRELRRGDLVRFVAADGSRVTFRVQRKESHPKNRFPTHRVYGATRAAELRLITCTGSFDTSTGHYRNNLIVFARRV